jgi:hypothetical protein
MESDKLPAIATVAELAEFERVDPRTLRADIEGGKVPGAFRRGRSWRVYTAAYLKALSPCSDTSIEALDVVDSAR